MSPEPHAHWRRQHCPAAAAPRSYSLPDPKKIGWVGGRKNARAAAAAQVLRGSGRSRVCSEQELVGVRQVEGTGRCALADATRPSLFPRPGAPVSAAGPLWALRRLRDHQGPLAVLLVPRLVSWCN